MAQADRLRRGWLLLLLRMLASATEVRRQSQHIISCTAKSPAVKQSHLANFMAKSTHKQHKGTGAMQAAARATVELLKAALVTAAKILAPALVELARDTAKAADS